MPAVQGTGFCDGTPRPINDRSSDRLQNCSHISKIAKRNREEGVVMPRQSVAWIGQESCRISTRLLYIIIYRTTKNTLQTQIQS